MRRRFLTALLIAAAAAVPAWAATSTTHTVWEHRFKSDHLEYEYRAAEVSGDGSVWLLLGTRPKGMLGGAEARSLWKISADGKSRQEIVLPSATGNAAAGGPMTHDVAALASSVIVLSQSGSGEATLTAIEVATGKVLWNKPLPGAPEVVARRMIALTGGDALVLVQRSGKPWLLRISDNGDLVWEKSVARDDVSLLVDAAAAPDGGFVVAGTHAGPAKTVESWLGRFSAAGELQHTNGFTGGSVSVTRTEKGYAAVFGGSGGEVWTRAFDANLKTVASVKVFTGVAWPPLVSPFRVVSTDRSDLLVAFLDAGKPRLARIAADGRIAWEQTHVEADVSWQRGRHAAIVRGPSFALSIATMVVVGASGEQRELVHLARLENQ